MDEFVVNFICFYSHLTLYFNLTSSLLYGLRLRTVGDDGLHRGNSFFHFSSSLATELYSIAQSNYSNPLFPNCFIQSDDGTTPPSRCCSVADSTTRRGNAPADVWDATPCNWHCTAVHRASRKSAVVATWGVVHLF